MWPCTKHNHWPVFTYTTPQRLNSAHVNQLAMLSEEWTIMERAASIYARQTEPNCKAMRATRQLRTCERAHSQMDGCGQEKPRARSLIVALFTWAADGHGAPRCTARNAGMPECQCLRGRPSRAAAAAQGTRRIEPTYLRQRWANELYNVRRGNSQTASRACRLS